MIIDSVLVGTIEFNKLSNSRDFQILSLSSIAYTYIFTNEDWQNNSFFRTSIKLLSRPFGGGGHIPLHKN